MKELLRSQWSKIIFINYILPAEIAEQYLPAQLKADHLNGNCSISLVGKKISQIKFSDVKIPALADFEQVDLRIAVKRFDGAQWRKGYLIIERILGNPALNVLSKLLLYSDSKTSSIKNKIEETNEALEVEYSWAFRENEHKLRVAAGNLPSAYEPNSSTAFFLDRPYEYATIGNERLKEIEFTHSQWHTYKVNEYVVKVDFAMEFGARFSILTSVVPQSVILAEGSTVTVNDNGNF